MAESFKRGEVGSQVSSWVPSSNTVTPNGFASTILPYGLQLKSVSTITKVTNGVQSGSVCVYTTSEPHYLAVGQSISVFGISGLTNGNVQNQPIVSVPTSTTFTVTVSTTGTFSGSAAYVIPLSVAPIPSDISWVYAIIVGAGGVANSGASYGGGGGGGGVAWGWVPATSYCLIGAASTTNPSGYTRYSSLIAGNGANGNAIGGNAGNAGYYGSGGGGGSGGGIAGINGGGGAGGTSYFGIPGGVGGGASPGNGDSGAGGGGGSGVGTTGGTTYTSGNGGNGISGGGAGINNATSTAQIAGFGGSGFVGGGGGGCQTSGLRTGGAGGSGFNILTGLVSTGGTPTIGTGSFFGGGGGGGGLLANGSNAVNFSSGGAGGRGGGGGGSPVGVGGAGAVFLFY